MGAPQPARNRLPPEVSPVFLGDTVKYFQHPMSQASPGSSRPGHRVAHWTSARCGHLPRNLKAGTSSSTHTLLSILTRPNSAPLQVRPLGDCPHQPPHCSSQAPVSTLSLRKQSSNLRSVPCSELGPRGKDLPRCRLQILTGQWKPHKNKCWPHPGGGKWFIAGYYRSNYSI